MLPVSLLQRMRQGESMLSIGLMSGTSMDGIDAALLETDGTPALLIERGHATLPYSDEFKLLLKMAEFVIRKYQGNLAESETYFQESITEFLTHELNITSKNSDDMLKDFAAYLHGEKSNHLPITLDAIINYSTQLHGHLVHQLIAELGYDSTQIDVVGYHGQCMFHQPKRKVSIIVGNGQQLANQVNITVVNDFRRCDIAAGGLGAPFAPLYHHALAVRDNKMPIAFVNCGGISNITLISGKNENDLLAFDTGPGNNLIDRLVRLRTSGQENMDINGQYGLRGTINEKMIELLYAKSTHQQNQNYFLLQPPKSLDVGEMQLIPELEALSLEDACATLEAFTARMIVKSLDLVRTPLPFQWILAGGGWKNPVIVREFQRSLKNKLGESVSIQHADEMGWNSQAMEAQIFAYFAVRSLQNKPLSVFGTTQVPIPMSGGHAHVPLVGSTPAVNNLLKLNSAVLQGYQVKSDGVKPSLSRQNLD